VGKFTSTAIYSTDMAANELLGEEVIEPGVTTVLEIRKFTI
jgi:hypothetical protein